MGFLSGLANATGLQMANIEANPEQAAAGANTPETTYAMNKTVAPTMGKQYTPTVNMYGGYTQGEMQQNAAQGYSNTGPAVVNAAGQATAAYLTGGASAAGQAALDQYTRNNPNSNLTQQVNYAANPSVNGGIDAEPNVSVNRGINYGYKKGGSVKGLSDLAHHLKAQGRNGDTELVHMDKGEVETLRGIAKAHGGDLTTNPVTGLKEAGFLSSILPMVAGVALDVLSDGALTPMTAGMIVGAGDYAMTGSLKQGLLAGLGAYGGADLTSSLANLGGAGNVLSEADPAAWGSADTTGTAKLVGQGQGALQGLQNVSSNFLTSNLGSIAAATAPVLADATQPSTLGSVPSQANDYGQPLQRISPDFKGQFPAQPTPAYQAHYVNYKQEPYNAQTGTPAMQSPGATIYGSSGGIASYAPGGTARSTYDPSAYDPLTYMGESSAYDPRHYMPKAQMAAPVAGDTSTYQDTDPDTRNMSAYDAALTRLSKLGATPTSGLTPTIKPMKAAINTMPLAMQQPVQQAAPTQLPEVETMASGGNIHSDLGGYSDGGRLLRGPGDGMSDNIPAVIGKKQPARLADGEFVVPADVVSHLGNGSTEAGAKHLYAMMDKIRKARTGKTKQAPAVKANKYLPA